MPQCVLMNCSITNLLLVVFRMSLLVCALILIVVLMGGIGSPTVSGYSSAVGESCRDWKATVASVSMLKVEKVMMIGMRFFMCLVVGILFL